MSSDAPKFEFDFEERLFGRLWRWWQERRASSGPGVIDWRPQQRRLALIASLFAERPVKLVVAAGQGGVAADRLQLPCPFELAPPEGAPEPDPEAHAALTCDALLLRVIFGGAFAGVSHRGLSEAGPIGIHEVITQLEAELPGLKRRRLAVEAAAGPDFGWGVPLASDSLVTETGAAEAVDGDDEGVAEDATERHGRAPEQVTVADIDLDEDPDGLLMPSVEQVQTADAWRGGHRTIDGSDELGDHADALEEVDLGAMLRGGGGVGSVYHLDAGYEVGFAGGSPEGGLPFPEWDARARRYREGWVHVYPLPAPPPDAAWVGEAMIRQRAARERVLAELAPDLTRRRITGRQRNGADIDIDAVVHARASLKAGRTPSDRLYLALRPRERDLAVTLLLDQSLSSAGWLGGHRILDLTRDTALLVGEVAELSGSALEVLSFCSHTRRRCEVRHIKAWTDPWSRARARVGGLRPRGYTRLGPAMRYATRGLRAREARSRLLLLVTDGKPTDHDRYEGRYGVGDVRQAVREAEQAGVRVRSLCFASEAAPTLSAQFGAGRWQVVPEPARLPLAVAEVLGRWRRS